VSRDGILRWHVHLSGNDNVCRPANVYRHGNVHGRCELCRIGDLRAAIDVQRDRHHVLWPIDVSGSHYL
jgi:hypothetical protein